MKKSIFLCSFFLFIGVITTQAQNTSCDFDAKDLSYDIVLVAGQSNTHYGYPLDVKLDTVNNRVYSLNRLNGKDYRIDKAGPVLDFWTRDNNRNSFVTTFSNLYVNTYLKNSNRKVLIIPCGYSGSSIVSWTKGQNLYKDAISRVNYVLDNIPGSKVVAVLWHQGEANVGWNQYQSTLDKMIGDMRDDIKQDKIQEVPFILGGMVPYWVNVNESRKQQQAIIKNTPSRVENTGYADPSFPTVISKPNNAFDDIHFDAAGQREMGKRYFSVFSNMLNNENVQAKELVVLTQESNSKPLSTVLYPNPATELINVTSTKNIRNIKIYNQSQNPVFSKGYDEKTVTVSISNFYAGLYVVLVTLEDNTVESIKMFKK